MAITVLGGERATRALAAAAIARAHRTMPKLGRGGRDVIVVTADSQGYDPASGLPGSGLIVMTGRPSVVQAAAALFMGADAYLSVDLQPSRAADALDRVMRGQTHIEPETAEALRALVVLAGGLQPDHSAREIRLLLDLRSRGWGWGKRLILSVLTLVPHVRGSTICFCGFGPQTPGPHFSEQWCWQYFHTGQSTGIPR